MADYFMETQAHEWVLSSQNGAYALGTGNLLNQRKYNGLLIKSENDFQRTLLVSGISEEINWRGESFFIDSSHYSNCIYPEGFLHLVKSWLRPHPVFLYSALPHNEDILIKKEIMMDKSSSTVLVKYTNLGAHTLHFKLKPKFAMRNHHHLNEIGIFDIIWIQADIENSEEATSSSFSVQRTDTKISAFGWLQHGIISHDRAIYREVFYPWDAYRGYPATEDLVAPFNIEFKLKTNETNYLLFSDQNIAEPLIFVDNIEKRYQKLPLPFDMPVRKKKEEPSPSHEVGQGEAILSSLDYEDNVLFSHDDYLKILEQSMEDFIANDDIIAGFPWFGAWGRDTMISMEGALKLPKGAEISFRILQKYAKLIKNGLIPNMCSESHQAMNYISLDATLWFILRLYEVCTALNDFTKEAKKAKIERWLYVIDITEKIFESLVNKSHPGFYLRDDGLLEMRESFASATWMDAKVYDKAVTPRDGAPVEINALLFNAVCSYEKMIDEFNELSSKKDNIIPNQAFLEIGSFIQQSFHKFWIGNFLADRLIGDEPVRECRPNAIIATSLPFTDRLIELEKIQQIYETAQAELFTPYGIRTLSIKDPKFMRKYIGGCVERDKAYHQGTVWAWLILPYAKTWLWAHPQKTYTESIEHLSFLVEKFRNGYIRGHIASIAEVWDGDKPHFPKGCPAQAWSVSALYCIEKIIQELNIMDKKISQRTSAFPTVEHPPLPPLAKGGNSALFTKEKKSKKGG